MHDEAFRYVEKTLLDHYEELPAPVARVLDIGGRDVNGTTRRLYHGQVDVLDITDGPNVTHVQDARGWIADADYDLVVCTETLEHVERWPEIISTIGVNLASGGLAVITAACPPRSPHGCDGGDVGDEWYENIDPEDLEECLREWSNLVHVTTHQRGDVYAWAVR